MDSENNFRKANGKDIRLSYEYEGYKPIVEDVVMFLGTAHGAFDESTLYFDHMYAQIKDSWEETQKFFLMILKGLDQVHLDNPSPESLEATSKKLSASNLVARQFLLKCYGVLHESLGYVVPTVGVTELYEHCAGSGNEGPVQVVADTERWLALNGRSLVPGHNQIWKDSPQILMWQSNQASYDGYRAVEEFRIDDFNRSDSNTDEYKNIQKFLEDPMSLKGLTNIAHELWNKTWDFSDDIVLRACSRGFDVNGVMGSQFGRERQVYSGKYCISQVASYSGSYYLHYQVRIQPGNLELPLEIDRITKPGDPIWGFGLNNLCNLLGIYKLLDENFGSMYAGNPPLNRPKVLVDLVKELKRIFLLDGE